MKATIGLALILIVAFLFNAYSKYKPSPSLGDATSKGGSIGSAPRLTQDRPKPAPFPQNKTTIPSIIKVTGTINSSQNSAQDDIDAILYALEYYTRALSENPLGSNRWITEALSGENHKGIVLLDPMHPAISDTGELLDRWGSPFWFHPQTDALIEIFSAGPDKTLFTEDDISYKGQ